MGSSICFGIGVKSQMSAWPAEKGSELTCIKQVANVLSSAAVQIWHDECGAQASELSAALWPDSSAAGIEGTLHHVIRDWQT